MVFQNYAIFPNLTVAGNVAYGLKARQVAGEEIAERVTGALALVRLQGYGERWPHQLSGGQQQRVAIARALVSRPTVVFADEPTGNLDSRSSADILELMRSSVDVYGQTTVMVTHDAQAAAMADQVLLLADGLIVEALPRSTAHDIRAAVEELEYR
jgi:putative ABC transport system ATP-binding protein